MRSFTPLSTAIEGTWRQPSRVWARARSWKIPLALGNTARAGKSASSSEANTATGPPEARELLLGCLPGEVGVQPEMPEGRPQLPDGGVEGWVLGLREQKPSHAPEALLSGTESVEERGGTDLDEHPQKGACGNAGGGDERRPTDALGGYSHGPDRYGRPVGEAHERSALQAEAVEDVLRPESVPVPLGRGAGLRAKAGLAHDVGRVEAMALGKGQEPL
jgi:hypothetical protein